MKQKNLYLLVGPPASGKSTFLKKTMPLMEKARAISRDEIRFALVAEDEPYFSREDEVFECFLNEIRSSLNENDHTFVDATHINEGSRKKILRRINTKNVNVYCLVFNTPLDICLQRNYLRDGRRQVPEDAIRRMKESMTNPANDRFIKYDCIYYFNEDGESYKINKATKEVKENDLFLF